MSPLTANLLIGGAALTIGAIVLYRSVRREAWKRRVLSWVGVVIGVAFMGFGGLLGYAAWSERHTFAGPDRPTAEELARPAEPFAYRLLADDDEGHLATYEGDVILINLWATWCVPCLKEMPYLEQLQEEFGGEDLTVVTLTKEDRETALTQAHRLPANTVNAHAPDQGALPQPFRRGFRVLPTSTTLLDGSGRSTGPGVDCQGVLRQERGRGDSKSGARAVGGPWTIS